MKPISFPIRPPLLPKQDAQASEPWVDIDAAATHLRASRGTLEGFVRGGCPCIDLATPTPNRRRKRALRFQLGAVERWLQARSGNGGRA